MKNTFEFDFTKGDFMLDGRAVSMLTGVDALRVWIEKVLRTQVGRYTMLDVSFTAVTVYGEIEEVQTYDAA